MIPNKSTSLKEHISPKQKDTGFNVLKTAAVFGANAAGKSNLIKAIEFVKKYVVDGKEQLGLFEPYKFSTKGSRKPSEFEIEIRSGTKAYAFGFVLSNNLVIEEWLYEISTKAQYLLYERKVDVNGKSSVERTSRFYRNQVDDYKKDESKGFFSFIDSSLLPDELFLTSCINKNVISIPPISDIAQFFLLGLMVLTPDSRSMSIIQLFHFGDVHANALCETMRRCDTSVSDLVTHEISKSEIAAEIGEVDYDDVASQLRSRSEDFVIIANAARKYFILDKDESGIIKNYKLVTVHKMIDSDETVYFDLSHESDGTQRLLDLLPITIPNDSRSMTFVVDELNRSLHPLVSIELVKAYHEKTKDVESQLIFTTHEDLLLDTELLRKDEYWLVDNIGGRSVLTPLSDFKFRAGVDVSTAYMYGRYGGIPQIK